MKKILIISLVLAFGYGSLIKAVKLPLHDAVEKGDLALLKALLMQKIFEVDAKDEDGNSPLYKAVQKGDKEMVLWLLLAGANVNTVNSNRSTPLQRAALAGDLEVVQLLLWMGANPNAKDKFKDTPLHFAAKLFKGMDLFDHYSENTLMGWKQPGTRVAEQDKMLLGQNVIAKLEIVKRLLAAGADKTLKNSAAEAPVDIAMAPEIKDFLNSANQPVAIPMTNEIRDLLLNTRLQVRTEPSWFEIHKKIIYGAVAAGILGVLARVVFKYNLIRVPRLPMLWMRESNSSTEKVFNKNSLSLLHSFA